MAYPRYQASRSHKFARRTAGDLNLTGSTTWANLDTGLDLVLAAQTGDVVEANLQALADSQAVDLFLDVVTIVSASPLNSFAEAGAVVTTPGRIIPGWRCAGSAVVPISGPMPYAIVAGDIVSGLVTFRIRYAMNTATNRTVYASANYPIVFSVKNLGPVDPN